MLGEILTIPSVSSVVGPVEGCLSGSGSQGPHPQEGGSSQPRGGGCRGERALESHRIARLPLPEHLGQATWPLGLSTHLLGLLRLKMASARSRVSRKHSTNNSCFSRRDHGLWVEKMVEEQEMGREAT